MLSLLLLFNQLWGRTHHNGNHKKLKEKLDLTMSANPERHDIRDRKDSLLEQICHTLNIAVHACCSFLTLGVISLLTAHSTLFQCSLMLATRLMWNKPHIHCFLSPRDTQHPATIQLISQLYCCPQYEHVIANMLMFRLCHVYCADIKIHPVGDMDYRSSFY